LEKDMVTQMINSANRKERRGGKGKEEAREAKAREERHMTWVMCP
jgi:hypothetical protein